MLKRDSRGEISLLGAFIALMVGAALAGGVIEATAPKQSPPPAVFARVNSTKIVRADDGSLQITVRYTAAVEAEADSGAAPWTANSTITCSASDEDETGGGHYDKTQDVAFILPGTSQDRKVTITTAPRTIPKGSLLSVGCTIARENRIFASDPVEAFIPDTPTQIGKPEPGSSGQPDIESYLGTYQSTFRLTVGIVLNCGDSTVPVTIGVSSLGRGRIKVTLSSASVAGAATGFETELAPTAQFSGELPSFGLMTGQFESSGGTMTLTGTAKSPDGHCAWTINGRR